jgi:hypothetical protein
MTDEEFRTDLKEILDGLANGDLWWYGKNRRF